MDYVIQRMWRDHSKSRQELMVDWVQEVIEEIRENEKCWIFPRLSRH